MLSILLGPPVMGILHPTVNGPTKQGGSQLRQNLEKKCDIFWRTHINLEEALVWAEKAISEPFRNAAQGRADFSTLQTKAQILQALGRNAQADSTMDQATNIDGTPVIPMHQYGMSVLNAGRKERALEIFKLNRKHHPDDQFFTFVGLARGYTAVGDKKNAIKSWETALLHVPPVQKRFLPQYEQALKALKDAKTP